jgi:inhibitor of KinA sporulation pathway (predicted exonuclease)
MKPYVSIDIETTGIDEDICQVLSVGAVIDDWVSPVEELPTFHGYVDHGVFQGTAYALSMHPHIFRTIAVDRFKHDPVVYRPNDVAEAFEKWLRDNEIDPRQKKIVVAGKNFGPFDHQFLKRLPMWKAIIRMKHRFIDPGNLYYDPTIDDGPPDTKTCMVRAGIDGEVAHTALGDAVIVARLIRYWVAHRHDVVRAQPVAHSEPGIWRGTRANGSVNDGPST